jgi:hypothetical protein
VAHSVSSNPTANSKTITYNETINPDDRVNFETDVDELMKAIQAKEDEDDDASGQILTPAHTPKHEMVMDMQSPASSCHTSTPAPESKPRKKWVCDGPSCNKRFVQKTHLDIHRRTHTGLKPYICTKDNCGLTFSQRGNLKVGTVRCNWDKPSLLMSITPARLICVVTREKSLTLAAFAARRLHSVATFDPTKRHTRD